MYLQDRFKEKTQLTKLIVTTIIFALGVNMISSSIVELIPNKKVILIIGILLSIFSLGFFILDIVKRNTLYKKLSIPLPFERATNRLIEIPRFRINEDIIGILSATFKENKALEKLWNESKMSIRQDNSSNSKGTILAWGESTNEANIKNQAKEILREAAEFIVIQDLSNHLADYFNGFENREKYVDVIERDEIPDILIKNRIIYQLTAPFKERLPFMQSDMKIPSSEENIIGIYGEDGTYYKNLILTLPKKTKVYKDIERGLIFDNNKFKVRINVINENYSYVLPEGFLELYMKESEEKIDIQTLILEIEAKIKPFAYFFTKWWKLNNWFDVFFIDLLDKCSFESFTERIAWDERITDFWLHTEIKDTDQDDKNK
ncbi:MAG: hypothetical protein Q7J06_11555 [Bacteroidales bacterium]|nr:hypothetical protein [Bacteroidales bacterium]